MSDMATEVRNEREPASTPTQRVDLPVGSMNCASCAARVEKALNGVPGVQSASVNFATATATVRYDPSRVTHHDLCAAVQEAGYTAAPPREESPGERVPAERGWDEERAARAREYADLRRKFWVSAALSTPVFVISMAMIQFPFQNWVLLALTLPVLFWAGGRIYRSAWAALKHRAADLNTPVAVIIGASCI